MMTFSDIRILMQDIDESDHPAPEYNASTKFDLNVVQTHEAYHCARNCLMNPYPRQSGI